MEIKDLTTEELHARTSGDTEAMLCRGLITANKILTSFAELLETQNEHQKSEIVRMCISTNETMIRIAINPSLKDEN